MIVVTTNDFINENPCGTACPCSSIAKTKQFADAANNRNKTIPNNQKEPTLL